MGTAGGIAIGGANMWALLLDKDPGHSAGATDLAVDVIDLKLKKEAPAVAPVKVKEAPPARNVAKPAKRVDKTKKSKKRAAGRSSNPPAASASSVDCGGKVQVNGYAGDNKQAAASDDEELTNMWIRRYLSQEETSKKSEKFVVVAGRGGRRRTVAPGTCKPASAEGFTVTGANMWALLSDEDTALAEVEEAPPADDTVDGIAHDVLSAGGANLPKHVKKTKTKKTKTKKKKMKGAAKGSKQAAATVDDAEVRINTHDELEEEATSDSDEEEEMTGEVATCSSRCRMVAWRICRAAIAVGLLALFQLPSAPPVAA